jgi:superfamily II DNA or RNA helicase
MLRDINLANVYDSSDGSIIDRLLVPALARSVKYRRGVGYFSSSWLTIASNGLIPFIENGGKAEFIVSPWLSEADWDAIRSAEEARKNELLAQRLIEAVADLENAMQNDARNVFAWMIYIGVLELRIAIPRTPWNGGMYHDKVGVITDRNNDSIAFHGSLNDSIHGSMNGEAFTVFRSWEESQFDYWNEHRNRLEMLWTNRNTQFEAINLPEAVRENIVSFRMGGAPPFTMSPNQNNSLLARTFPTLRDYQQDAISSWAKASFQGVFEMATGTGKTITALGCAKHLFQKNHRIFVIIIVPYIHLMDQWAREIRKYIGAPVLCASSRPIWNEELTNLVEDFNIGATNEAFVLAVAMTASSQKFSKIMSRLRWSNKMLIADEVHSLGSSHLRKCLDTSYTYRLGLSATPRRWFDFLGTDAIFDYFGSVCFSMSLAQAIAQNFLVPYRYWPIIVELDEGEEEEYRDLTRRIGQFTQGAKKNEEISEQLKRLLIARAAILNNARTKLPSLLHHLEIDISKSNDIGQEQNGLLIYCAPGGHRKVLQEVAGLGLRCHEFVASTDPEARQLVLRAFGEGEYQALVAIKCLDEGVDVPATRIAYILASSTNPREFVQRRGRVLRPSPGKNSADVYDFFVIPSEKYQQSDRNGAKAMLRRQLPRFAEFSADASNTFEARSTLWDIVKQLGLIADLDKKPWEIAAEIFDNMEVVDE